MRIFTVLVLSLAALPAWAFDNWDEDLDDYARQLESGHINLYHSISADDFRAELDAIRADAGAVPRFETVTRLMRLTRRINDGHTAMPLWNQSLRVFPFGVKLFEGEVFVTSAPK
ncbi:MAG: hypothetical protein R3270_10885, partial [Gammaproteobacteria bacterium]|nr:hypothetical protein [Gammaproteobacteria bacterium]